MTALLTGLLGLALVATLEFVLYVRRFRADRRAAALRRRISAVGHAASEEDREALLRRERFARRPALEALLRRFGPARRLEHLIEQADADVTVAQILGWSAGILVGGLLLALALSRPALTLGAVAGALVPLVWLFSARARRSRRLSEQLPEALQMMSRSLRAGHALSAAFENVALELPDPVSIEFAQAFEEQRLGLAFDEVVKRMAVRCAGNGDVKIFAISAVIQRETGGNLSEILDRIAATIRDRFRFQGKLRAVTAEGRASAWVLGSLPFIVAMTLAVVSPHYLGKLLTDPLGNAILAVGAICWVVGQYAMFRLARVTV